MPIVTCVFGGAALAAMTIVALLPPPYKRWRARPPGAAHRRGTAAAQLAPRGRCGGCGREDSMVLLRDRPAGVLIGSFGYSGFDIVAMGLCFVAVGDQPSFGVLAWGYLIGQLAGLIPIPDGIGATELGLVGQYALYGVPVSKALAAVLICRALQIWIPAVLGSVAFVELYKTLSRKLELDTVCQALAEPIQTELTTATLRERHRQNVCWLYE